jgi:hypothetical protein
MNESLEAPETRDEKEKRVRNRALSIALAAALVALLAPSAAFATGYNSCSAFQPTVTVLAGPCPVSSANPAACEASGPYTGIKYRVSGRPDHIATIVTANNQVLSVPSYQFYGACVGDPATGLGKNSCHERAVKINSDCYTSGEFWVVVDKAKSAVLQSIAVKKGSCVKSFAVAGFGSEVNPFVQARKTETVNFKGCAVTFEFDPITNAVLNAQLDPGQSSKPICTGTQNDGTCCAFNGGADISKLVLTLDGEPLGAGQIGEGYVSSGTNSCTTRIIGGRVYTWGSPCPE